MDSLGRWGKPLGHYEKWRLNSLGYRGPELTPDSLRIMVSGASETFGLYESEGHEYPRLLEQRLQPLCPSRKIDVVNVSYPGLTKSSLLSRIPSIAAQVRPTFALIYPIPVDYIESPSPRRTPGPIGPVREPNKLRIIGKVRNLVKATVPTPVMQTVRAYNLSRILRNVHAPLSVVPEERLHEMRSDHEQLILALIAEDITPVLVTHVTRFGPDIPPAERAWLTAWRQFYPVLEEDGFLDLERRANEVFRSIAVEYNLLLIDAAEQMPAAPVYFADFVHFTDIGAERIASILAQEISPDLTLACGSGRNKPANDSATTP